MRTTSRRKGGPTPQQIGAAMQMYAAASSARTSRQWLIHWPEIEPTVCRYQWPVTLAHVLREHHAAIAAEPIDEAPR